MLYDYQLLVKLLAVHITTRSHQVYTKGCRGILFIAGVLEDCCDIPVAVAPLIIANIRL
jgi:hypothetical protein